MSDLGKNAKRKIMSYYFDDLLNIIHEIDINRTPGQTVLVGDSHIFINNTARKLGLKISDVKPVVN